MADLSRLSRQQLDALIEAGGDPAKVAPDIASSINHTLYGYTPPPPPMQGALGSGVDTMQANVQTTLADLAGNAGLGSLSQSLLESADANKKAANFVSSVPTYKDIGGIGDALTYAKDLALGQAGYYGGLIGAAGAGALAAPFVGVGAGAGALGATLPFMFSTLVGENLNAQMTEKGVPLQETNSLAAYGTGVLQTALEATIGKFLPKGLAVDGIKAFRRAGGVKAVPRLAENAVRGGVVEGLTEGAQQALTILQANPDKLMSMSPEVIDEIVNAAVAGAVIGGGLSMVSGEFDVASDKRLQREKDADQALLIKENNARAKGLQDAHKLTVEEQISLGEELDRQKAEETKGGPETRNERLLPPPVDTVRRRDDSSFEPGPILPDELIVSKDGKEPPKSGLEIVQTEDGFAVRGAVSGTFYKGRLRTREEAQTYKANVEDEIASRWLTKKVKDAELEGDFATAREIIDNAADSKEGYQYSPALIAELSGRVSRNEGAASQVVGHVNNQISAIKEAMADFKGKKSAPEYTSWKTRLAGLEAQRRATMAGLAKKNDSFDPDVFPTR